MRSIQMLDLKAEAVLYGDAVRRAALAVLDSQQFIGGPAIGELERTLAARLGTKHAVAVSNGTDALLLAMMALDIGHGDEVIVPAFTFMATAGTVARLGARPVFCDIDPRTFNLDPRHTERLITPRTKAIMPVHLYGQCAEMNAINDVAAKHRLAVIEDAAQAVGATYHGRPACALGTMASLSFYPTKNLGGYGEGGMVLTSDDALDRALRMIRNHGESQRYYHDRIGGNFRLDTMKAAILLAKLPHLDEFTKRRRRSAALYDELLAGGTITTPYISDGQAPVYHQYTILCDRRDELKDFLAARGIGTAIYYPIPLHMQKCFASLGHRAGDFPVSEHAAQRVLSLPCHPMLTDDDVRCVAGAIREFDRGQPATAMDRQMATGVMR